MKDPNRIIQLILLTDTSCHLNALDLRLQGRTKLPGDMLKITRALQNKITLWVPDREHIRFPKLRATTTSEPSLQQLFSYRGFVEVLEELRGECQGLWLCGCVVVFEFLCLCFLAVVSSWCFSVVVAGGVRGQYSTTLVYSGGVADSHLVVINYSIRSWS